MERDVHLVELQVNGTRHELAVESRHLLSDVLRHQLGLTGTHVGCEHGICGACTVLVNGEPARSCLTFAIMADGKDIQTVEGLAGPDDELNALQASFSANHGLQCGFCTPGFLMLSTWLLAHEPSASPERVREVIAANLCRCTGYQGIVEAVVALTVPSAQPESDG